MAVAIELEAVRLSDGVVNKFYFSSDQFHTRPGDTPPRTFFQPVIKRAPALARVLFEGVSTYGASKASWGSVDLINEGGTLGYLLTDYALDGRPLVVRYGTDTDNYAAWPIIMSGVMSGCRSSGNTLTLVVRDLLVQLDTWTRPEFLGDNVAPNGLEGTPKDIKGQQKPWLFGRALNMTAVVVNTSKLIYQISDLPCLVTEVWDNGKAYTLAAPYASLAELQATAPAVSNARAYRGYIRFGSTPVGPITASAQTSDLTATGNLRALALLSGVASADISADAVPNTAPLGVWVTENTSARSAMDEIASSVGAWYGFDRTSKFRMGRIEAPSGAPVAVWDEREVLANDLLATTDPFWRVSLRYARNYTTQSTVADLADAAHKAWVAQEYRTAVKKDEDIKTFWPSAKELTYATALVNEADAVAEALRIFGIYSVRRFTYSVEIPTRALGAADLGKVVRVDIDRNGMQGKLLLVIGLDTGFSEGRTKLVLWG